MEIITTAIATILLFYGIAKLASAIANFEEKRKAASEAAWINEWR